MAASKTKLTILDSVGEGAVGERHDRPKPKPTLPGLQPVQFPADPEKSPSSASDSQIAALLGERDKLRKELAAAEALARGVAEAKQVTYPPSVEPAKPEPRPKVEEAPDAAIGRSVRYLLGRAAPFLLAAAGVGGGVTAIAKPSADPAKATALETRVATLERDYALTVEQVTGQLKREPPLLRYIQCLEEQQRDIGEQALPAPDRMGSAKPPRPFVERCSRLRP